MKLDDYTLSRLRQLAENATPGPWRWGTGEENNGDWPQRYLVTVKEFESKYTPSLGPLSKTIIVTEDDFDGWDNPANAPYFCALTPEVVLALIEGYKPDA